MIIIIAVFVIIIYCLLLVIYSNKLNSPVYYACRASIFVALVKFHAQYPLFEKKRAGFFIIKDGGMTLRHSDFKIRLLCKLTFSVLAQTKYL